MPDAFNEWQKDNGLPVTETIDGNEVVVVETPLVEARLLEPGDRINGSEVLDVWAYQEGGTAAAMDDGRVLTFDDDEGVEVDR